ncbi:hypothetical protein [Brachyspira pulli]
MKKFINKIFIAALITLAAETALQIHQMAAAEEQIPHQMNL